MKSLIALFVSAAVVCGCGNSQETKAKIRLAMSAFNRAYEDTAMTESTLAELQRAVDVVPDGDARTELLRCQNLLIKYRLSKQITRLSIEENLDNTGHGDRSTRKDVDAAIAKATTEHPLPPIEPIAQCSVNFMLATQ